MTALDGFTPASLKNVNLHRPSDVSWADVGGLHDVRHRLVETLLWPSKVNTLLLFLHVRVHCINRNRCTKSKSSDVFQ